MVVLTTQNRLINESIWHSRRTHLRPTLAEGCMIAYMCPLMWEVKSFRQYITVLSLSPWTTSTMSPSVGLEKVYNVSPTTWRTENWGEQGTGGSGYRAGLPTYHFEAFFVDTFHERWASKRYAKKYVYIFYLWNIPFLTLTVLTKIWYSKHKFCCVSSPWTRTESWNRWRSETKLSAQENGFTESRKTMLLRSWCNWNEPSFIIL